MAGNIICTAPMDRGIQREVQKVEAMQNLTSESARLFAAKEARRHNLAALPFPEKVRAVVRLQEMAAPVLRARGRIVRVWTLDNRVA
jgi:hypothetical protein